MAVNGQGKSRRITKQYGKSTQGIKATKTKIDITPEDEVNMMSDNDATSDMRSQKELPNSKKDDDDHHPTPGAYKDMGNFTMKIIKSTIEMMEPQFERMAQTAAEKAIASMNVKVKQLEKDIAFKNEEIARLETEKKYLENENLQKKDLIQQKDNTIKSLKREVKGMKKEIDDQKKKIMEEESKAAKERREAEKHRSDLDAEKARHLQTRAQANVNMKKMKDKETALRAENEKLREQIGQMGSSPKM